MAFSYDTWGDSWSDSWADAWGEQEPAPVGLGFATPRPPAVDFVISSPYYLRQIQVYRNATETPQPFDDDELQEMIQLYSAAQHSMRART